MSAIGALHLPLIKASLRKVKDKRKVSLVNAGETQQHIANQGETPLTYATKKGHLAIVKLLIEEGDADVDVPNEKGETPLCLALVHGHSDVARILAKHAAPGAMQQAKQEAASWCTEAKIQADAELREAKAAPQGLGPTAAATPGWRLRRKDTLPCRMRLVGE